MKTLLFLDGSNFKHNIIESFVNKHFKKHNLIYFHSDQLSSVFPPKSVNIANSLYDIIVIGDNIKMPDERFTKAPFVIRDHIVSALTVPPKICLFTNAGDYTKNTISEEVFAQNCSGNNLAYVNNLSKDAFVKLHKFIKSSL